MEFNQLSIELKQLIINECDRSEMSVDNISDDEILFGANSQVALDSLDALQIAVAIQKQYGVRLQASGPSREAFKNISSLANYIIHQQ